MAGDVTLYGRAWIRSRDLERHRPPLSHVNRCRIRSTSKLHTTRNAVPHLPTSLHKHKVLLDNLAACQSIRFQTRSRRLLRRRPRRRPQMARRPEPRHHPARSVRDYILAVFRTRRPERQQVSISREPSNKSTLRLTPIPTESPQKPPSASPPPPSSPSSHQSSANRSSPRAITRPNQTP